MSLLEIRDLTIQFGGLKAVSDVNLSLEAGQMIGLIGPNGAGKTTLFNAITGVVPKTTGSLLFDGKDLSHYKPNQIAHLGISRTFQNIRLFSKMTAEENCGHRHQQCGGLWHYLRLFGPPQCPAQG